MTLQLTDWLIIVALSRENVTRGDTLEQTCRILVTLIDNADEKPIDMRPDKIFHREIEYPRVLSALIRHDYYPGR